jgi:tetratricopeptide (TPR) repeat protein
MLYDVRHRRLARRLGEESEMKLLAIVVGFFFTVSFAVPAGAGGITLSPEAARALDEIYSGNPDRAIAAARNIGRDRLESPVGDLLEGEALWCKTYCAACEIKWGQLDAWKRAKQPEDDAYFALADKAIALARAQLAKSDTAEMHLYVGLGFALKARLYSLRDEKHNVARAGVAARAEFIRALQLDPDMADATAGLGLYNYYVDTLSSIAKMLRFFMGIPGGNKEEGIRQMKVGIERGAFFSVDSRFYLARNLRTYDKRYEEALSVMEPLIVRYPRNPVFQLLAGNLNAELGRNAKASEYFHAVLAPSPDADLDPACTSRVRDLANSFLASLH